MGLLIKHGGSYFFAYLRILAPLFFVIIIANSLVATKQTPIFASLFLERIIKINIS